MLDRIMNNGGSWLAAYALPESLPLSPRDEDMTAAVTLTTGMENPNHLPKEGRENEMRNGFPPVGTLGTTNLK